MDAPDPAVPSSPISVRHAELTGALAQVLLDADGPMPAGRAIAGTRDILPWTPFEESKNDSGIPRADTHLRFMSGEMSVIGWLDKTHGWQLTPRGRETLSGLDSMDAVYPLMRATYSEYRRKNPYVPKGARSQVIPLLDALPPGCWTSYGDIAKVIGLGTQQVGTLVGQSGHESVHRVLTSKGTVSPGFRWPDPERTDDPLDLLRAEGVSIDESGRANPADRLTAEELRELIDPEAGPVQRAWLVRGGSVGGRNLVPEWFAEGRCSVPSTQLRALELPLSREQISGIVEEDYSGKSYNQRQQKVTELDAFLNRVQTGDLVVTNDEASFRVGTITGAPSAAVGEDGRREIRRPVDWAGEGAAVDLLDLPPILKAKVTSSQTLVDLSAALKEVRGLLPGTEVTETPELRLADADQDLSEAVLMDQRWLQQCIDLLRDRRQMIFYGPPGTGKTYLAMRLARHLAGADGTTLVQFHPAYSYEDFFEGYRPTTTPEGTIAFELKPGPFRRIVDAARENPSKPFVLVIDEINRANLAKVFGELYFLLEYRDESIDLLYRSGDEDAFTLPPNVFVIGTMNTADRSIALVDSAMRRRFAFRELHPGTEPTAGLLRRWLEREGRPSDVADLLDALNARVPDRELAIGPSYFMRESVHRPGGLELLWETDILPLLEEHHYGDGTDVARRYRLDALFPTAPAGPEPGQPDGA